MTADPYDLPIAERARAELAERARVAEDSERAILTRIAAYLYPTPAQVAHAMTNFGSWHEIVNATMGERAA